MSSGSQLVLFEREFAKNRRWEKNREHRPGGRNIKCKGSKMNINMAKAFRCNGRCRKRLERKIRRILRVLGDI